jgi:CBS domain-containing protein
MLTVTDIMTREPYTLGPDDSLADARSLMAQHHIRHIPVVAGDGIVAGVVSQRDVLAAEDSHVINPEGENQERDSFVALSSIMSSPAQTIDEYASLRGTALHLQQHKLGCLPVTRDGKLVGIITDADFVSIAINLMEQLEEVEPEPLDYDDAQADDPPGE